MKLTVKIQDRSFEVEIEDLSARPIVATVEGERFEIWPENGGTGPQKTVPAGTPASAPASSIAQRFA
ncbi:MAG: acetyl-CoA carboxylase biotin carboxyl carrier protein subunit, partial [Chloroflexi bacterium]